MKRRYLKTFSLTAAILLVFLLIGFCTMGWGYSLILLPIGLWVFFLNYIVPR